MRQRQPTEVEKAFTSPWFVAAVIFIVYSVWFIVYTPRSHGGFDFMFVGTQFLQSHASSAINIDTSVLRFPEPVGYDGQFSYYIAVDPLHARYYVTAPAYRLTRILYPMTAKLLALGQNAAIPYTLFIVNILAATGGVLALAFWLRRRGISTWFALIFGLYPGLVVGTTLDLNEPLAYALVALGVYLFDFGGSRRMLFAGITFGLAALAREISIIFGAVYGLSLLFDYSALRIKRIQLGLLWRQAVVLLVAAILPLLLWKIVLWFWLGSTGTGDVSVVRVPFSGIWELRPWLPWHVKEIWCIIVPSLILFGMATLALVRRVNGPAIWALLVNLVVCVFTLSSLSFDAFLGPSRISLGVAVAAVLCLPAFDSLAKKGQTWQVRLVWIGPCALLWLWLSYDWAATLQRAFPS